MKLQTSFMITYIILLTTGTICFIEAIRTNIPTVRHILNLETCISIVGAYFYSIFIQKLKDYEEQKKQVNWNEITQIRYLDWAITTPMMLIVLCAMLAYNIKSKVHFSIIGIVLLLNYAMLGLGYLGEINTIDKSTAFITSFVSFFAMYYLIYKYYLCTKYHFPNYVLYFIYFVAWTFYGIAYLLEPETKNIVMNTLDLISKGIIGIGIWAYFTHIIVR